MNQYSLPDSSTKTTLIFFICRPKRAMGKYFFRNATDSNVIFQTITSLVTVFQRFVGSSSNTPSLKIVSYLPDGAGTKRRSVAAFHTISVTSQAKTSLVF